MLPQKHINIIFLSVCIVIRSLFVYIVKTIDKKHLPKLGYIALIMGTGFIYSYIKNRKVDYRIIKKGSIEIGEEINHLSDEILNRDLSELSEQDLISSVERTWKLSHELSFLGMVPVVSDFDHFYLTKELKNIIKSKKNIKKKEHEYISDLLIPLDQSVQQKEKIDLLIIAKMLKENKDISKQLKEHTENYCWMDYSYQGPAHNQDFFLARLKDVINNTENLEEEKIKLDNNLKNISKKQEELKKELKLTEVENFIFDTARDFLFLKGYRMDVRSKSNYALEKLFKELGKRKGFSLEELRYMKISEFKDIDNIDKYDLRKRRSYSIWNIDKYGENILLDREAENFMANIVIDEKIEETNTIKGDSACLGKVKGNVKIINKAEDMKKMEHGDILVAITTNPNLVPAMQKASAIITDSGGITSHAAIVARELGKPCIIGTKIATKVLKDNELVEVDATNGIIRRLK